MKMSNGLFSISRQELSCIRVINTETTSVWTIIWSDTARKPESKRKKVRLLNLLFDIDWIKILLAFWSRQRPMKHCNISIKWLEKGGLVSIIRLWWLESSLSTSWLIRRLRRRIMRNLPERRCNWMKVMVWTQKLNADSSKQCNMPNLERFHSWKSSSIAEECTKSESILRARIFLC